MFQRDDFENKNYKLYCAGRIIIFKCIGGQMKCLRLSTTEEMYGM
jgi:hypothetical protein